MTSYSSLPSFKDDSYEGIDSRFNNLLHSITRLDSTIAILEPQSMNPICVVCMSIDS